MGTANATVTANFRQIFNLTTSVNDAAGGTVTAGQSGMHTGQTLPLTAEALPGWEFTHWSGDVARLTNVQNIGSNPGSQHHPFTASSTATFTTGTAPSAIQANFRRLSAFSDEDVAAIMQRLEEIRAEILSELAQNNSNLLDRLTSELNDLRLYLSTQITDSMEEVLDQLENLIRPWASGAERILTLHTALPNDTDQTATNLILIQGHSFAVGINIATPAREGLIFAGWATTQANANTGIVDITVGRTFIMPAHNMTLWAVWQPVDSVILP